jgi:hypothetical protein
MNSSLPPLYENWAAQFLGSPIPPELEATCDDCAMVDGGKKAPRDPQSFFDSTTRCCTYFPVLANFLVGQILADADPHIASGRRSVVARLERRLAVTPLGCGQPATYSLLYNNSRDGFGASHALRCPHHLDNGFCGIWAHRMSVCATWFCKYSRGAVGLKFWRALQVLLSGVEGSLAKWCLLSLKLDSQTLAHLFPPPDPCPSPRILDRYQIDERVNPDRYSEVWGTWAGRERELFEECGRLVKQLSWQEVLAICGPDVQVSVRLVREAFDALLSREVPARLRAGDFTIHGCTTKSALVVSYNGYDPLRLPSGLMEALRYFDGRPVAEALSAIAREKRLRLHRDLILKLVDFSILVPVPSQPIPRP